MCSIFVDLQKAFDSVDHEILISKLDHHGMRGNASKWLETYLCNGKQNASINGFKCNTSTLTCGVHKVLYLDLYSF